MLPIVIAGVAALAILLIFLGLAGSSPVDPVQARLTQLGTMQAKSLEERSEERRVGKECRSRWSPYH